MNHKTRILIIGLVLFALCLIMPNILIDIIHGQIPFTIHNVVMSIIQIALYFGTTWMFASAAEKTSEERTKEYNEYGED